MLISNSASFHPLFSVGMQLMSLSGRLQRSIIWIRSIRELVYEVACRFNHLAVRIWTLFVVTGNDCFTPDEISRRMSNSPSATLMNRIFWQSANSSFSVGHLIVNVLLVMVLQCLIRWKRSDWKLMWWNVNWEVSLMFWTPTCQSARPMMFSEIYSLSTRKKQGCWMSCPFDLGTFFKGTFTDLTIIYMQLTRFSFAKASKCCYMLAQSTRK